MPIPGSSGAQRSWERAQRMLPELNGLGLRDQEKRQPSEGRSQLVPLECFPPEVLPVRPPWMAQALGCLPSALPWQVLAENN